MFRLHRHRSQKSGERIDFKFSNFQAIQVPKGWDKLFVSIVSVESGKTIAKSSKASVRNGNCQWTESLSESIWLSQDNASKELEECLFKFVVSPGSVRSGILGEATVNLTGYINSRASSSALLPLKKCNHGTSLQVKIQCLTPRARVRDEQQKETNSHPEDLNADYDDMDNKSDGSDYTFNRSFGSSSSTNLGSTSHPGDLGIRDPSFSASGSHHSSDSAEGLIGRTNFSPRNSLTADVYNLVGRQDSNGPYSIDDHSQSNHASLNSRVTSSGSNLKNQSPELWQSSSPVHATPSLRNAGSSKDVEPAEDTIKELRSEAKMWERNARKLMQDLEILKKEFSDQSMHQADLDMELSAAYAEREGLKQEIEQLKVLLEESTVKQTATENSKFQSKGMSHVQKDLEEEIKFHQESNAELALQLKKTQESNFELVAILQELEETVEKQRLEIDNLSALKLKLNDLENCSQDNEDNEELNSNMEGSSVEITPKSHEAGEEDNSILVFQLKELQESQKSLQTTIELLEKVVEDKNQEIEVERSQRNQMLLNTEANWRHELSAKEEQILNLEAKLSDSLITQCSGDIGFVNGSNLDLLKEIEALKAKVQELERDCNELTDENLGLLLELKESKKDLLTGGILSHSLPSEGNVSANASEFEVSDIKSQIFKQEEGMNKEMGSDGVATKHLQNQLVDFQKKCNDLELQLQAFKDKECDLDAQLQKSQEKVEKQEMKIAELQRQLVSSQAVKMDREDHLSVPSTKNFESNGEIEIPKIFSELFEQLQLVLAHVQKPWYNFCVVNNGCENPLNNSEYLNCVHVITQKEQPEIILNDFVRLNKLLEEEISKLEEVLHNNEAKSKEIGGNVTDALKKLDIYDSKENRLQKEDEIEVLRCSKSELESQVSNLQKEKSHLEESIEALLRESSITSKSVDDARNDLMVLSSLESHVSSNKILERKLLELESGKYELELHLSELEEENIQLSERISGLEAQLRYLTDERETCRLELENSKAFSLGLQDEIRRLGVEMEAQKLDLKQKLQEMQKRWSEAQEECEYLKRANPKLQSTAENLIEECSSLQKLNGELRKQKLELHERCTHLETELRESQERFSDSFKKVEVLEKSLSSMQVDIASKGKFLTSELDALLRENKEHKEKLMGESLLNQMYFEKKIEIENLQREVAHLTEQISATHDEREVTASDAVLEVSSLRLDKAKLEIVLQEVQARIKSTENELDTLRADSEAKVESLIFELSASKQNQELLMADNDKLLRSLQDARASEDKLKSNANVLERKLSDSEYERKQVVEEITTLKVQLQKIAHLQEEVLALKSSLNETKFEKEKLEASLQLLSEDCEELKAERVSFLEKISSIQNTVSELEDCRRAKVALEEKLLRLEGDLTASSALCAHDAELKNELSRLKRANSQFQRKIQLLEEEKEEYLKKAQTLEEELQLKKEEKPGQSESRNKDLSGFSKSDTIAFPTHGEPELLKDEMENNAQHQVIWTPSLNTSPMQELPERQQSLNANQYEREGDSFHHGHIGSPHVIGVNLVSKIQQLENELAEALEANEMYKVQLRRLLSEGENGHSDAPKQLRDEIEILKKEGYEQKASLLEAELKEIRERYFHMSIRYAEVEAQREELVVELKTVKNGRRWFS
ncbi:centrosome-associated protein CEP250-like isoform X2 [Telopea speciosissima]|uniref:centrosome-associated protein CEP250-like isoform X2 n=1 Tax=Telopea speciosissima TaxID=54955 RepID=UPI001CC4F2BE|nr:centrosome-associated protein CEP250-like isoform X2 [Telopea speciosissima]